MKANPQEDYRLVVDTWAVCRQDATQVRYDVFVMEQNVPLDEELDSRDADCLHAVAYSPDGLPVGTGRLLPDGHIGRMAVRRPYRGQGVGAMLLKCLVEEARQRGHRQLELAAQLHAMGFYSAHGFIAEGPVFLDAGIEHRNMRRSLSD